MHEETKARKEICLLAETQKALLWGTDRGEVSGPTAPVSHIPSDAAYHQGLQKRSIVENDQR